MTLLTNKLECFPANIVGIKSLSKDKHSSLFVCRITGKEKSFKTWQPFLLPPPRFPRSWRQTCRKKSISCRVSHFYLRLIFAVIAADNKCSIQNRDESFSQQKLNDRNASKWTHLWHDKSLILPRWLFSKPVACTIKVFTVVIYDCNDSIIVIYDHNDSGLLKSYDRN